MRRFGRVYIKRTADGQTNPYIKRAPRNTMRRARVGIFVPPGGTHVFTAQVPVAGLFGKYKAFLSVEYGSTQRGSVQDTSFFYIIPWKFVLLVCMGIAVIVAYLAWHAHRRYFDDTVDDDHDQLLVRVRDGASEPKEHDLHIKRP